VVQEAAALGALVAAEEGVVAACAVIERHVGRPPLKLPPALRPPPSRQALRQQILVRSSGDVTPWRSSD
ncbi:MAG: hypothetical protein B7Z53_04890, partial [Rhodospirillales bacterium 12-71-4]